MKWTKLFNRLVVPQDIHELYEQMPKSVGSLGYDPWGFNGDSFKLAFTVSRWLYEHYFRVESSGLENIPAEGRVLLIGNHSGQLPMDGVMVGVAMATNPHGPRAARGMMERFFPTVPFVGNLLNQWGAVVGDPINCVKLLEQDEAVVVFPEGIRGSGKPWKDRYQLQRFGTGFMKIAIETQTPIVPIGIVGCEETMPSLGNIKPLADLLHIPYFPATVPVPLPSKVYLNFGTPHYFEGDSESEEVMTDRVEQVKQQIRNLIQTGQEQRQADGE